jgi:ribonuclease HI
MPNHIPKVAAATQKSLIIHCSGICEPRDAHYRFAYWAFCVVDPDGHEIHTASGCAASGLRPIVTSRLAQYSAVLQACRWLATNAPDTRAAIIYTPGAEIIEQIKGTARTRKKNLIPLRDAVRLFTAAGNGNIELSWSPASENPARPYAGIALAEVMRTQEGQ